MINGRQIMFITSALAIAAAGGAVLLGDNRYVAAALTAVVAASSLITIRAYVLRIVRANAEVTRRATIGQEQSLHSIYMRVQKTPDIAGTADRTRRDIQSLSDKIDNILVRTDVSVKTQSNHTLGTPKQRPAVLDAMAPHHSAQRSGRLAGAGSKEAAFGEIDDVLRPEPSEPAAIAAVLPSAAPPADEAFVWRALDPYFSAKQILKYPPNFLVIETTSFNVGKWANALDAAGTHLFLNLWESLILARNLNIPIVLIGPAPKTSTYTSELRSYVDIDATDGKYSIGHSTHTSIHVINRIIARASVPDSIGDIQ